MRKKRSQGRSLKAQRKAAVRAPITFPPDLYENLEEIARQKKVSLAWVVRDASEKYITDKRPVLAKEQQASQLEMQSRVGPRVPISQLL